MCNPDALVMDRLADVARHPDFRYTISPRHRQYAFVGLDKMEVAVLMDEIQRERAADDRRHQRIVNGEYNKHFRD